MTQWPTHVNSPPLSPTPSHKYRNTSLHYLWKWAYNDTSQERKTKQLSVEKYVLSSFLILTLIPLLTHKYFVPLLNWLLFSEGKSNWWKGGGGSIRLPPEVTRPSGLVFPIDSLVQAKWPMESWEENHFFLFSSQIIIYYKKQTFVVFEISL